MSHAVLLGWWFRGLLGGDNSDLTGRILPGSSAALCCMFAPPPFLSLPCVNQSCFCLPTRSRGRQSISHQADRPRANSIVSSCPGSFCGGKSRVSVSPITPPGPSSVVAPQDLLPPPSTQSPAKHVCFVLLAHELTPAFLPRAPLCGPQCRPLIAHVTM